MVLLIYLNFINSQIQELGAVRPTLSLVQQTHDHTDEDADTVASGFAGSGSEEDPAQGLVTLTGYTSSRILPGT